MPVPELPPDVVTRFARLLRDAIDAVKAENPAASEYQQASVSGMSRVQLRNFADGVGDRARGRPANPRLDTLVALSRLYGLRIVVDASTPDVVSFELDEATLRHNARTFTDQRP